MGIEVLNAYTFAMRQYLTVEGRTSRRDYWLFVLVIVAVLLIALFVDALFFSSPFVTSRFLTLLVGVAHLVPFITASVRRLHDADLSGWLYLLNALPFGQVIFIVLTCLPPTAGANKYGHAPVGQLNAVQTLNRSSPAAREPAVDTASASSAVAAPAVASAPAPRQPAASLDSSALDQLERLSSLRASGALTDAEFATLKAKLLSPNELEARL